MAKPHGLADGSTILVQTDGIGAVRLGKSARPSQSGEAERLGKHTAFIRKQSLFTMQDLTPIPRKRKVGPFINDLSRIKI